jgi:hypothetical protein
METVDAVLFVLGDHVAPTQELQIGQCEVLGRVITSWTNQIAMESNTP